MSSVHGRLENWPVTGGYIRSVVGPAWKPPFRSKPANFEQASLKLMPREIYETFVRGYTEKQWGVPAVSLRPTLASRFDVREDGETRLSRHKWQGVPALGYAAFMTELLRGIPVLLNCDYLSVRNDLVARRRLIYTGPIDEFFDFDLGRLGYRGQRREHQYQPDTAFAQPVVQVNNPSAADGPHIRTIEWKHMMPARFAERIQGTVLTRETPFTPAAPNEYEYPFPDDRNAALYEAYRKRADRIPGMVIAGRLGEYRYYDMDQAIGRGMVIGGHLLSAESTTKAAANA
jgi:UDP-galactopyranose mutase